MLLVTRGTVAGCSCSALAGLVPAALVTLLLVHQPSIGDRRLYPMLRGSLTLVGLGLALATVLAWATTPNRLSRPSLTRAGVGRRDGAAVHRPVPRELRPRPGCDAFDLRDGSGGRGRAVRTMIGDEARRHRGGTRWW